MNETSDPRAAGFNYGAALGAPDTIRFRQIVATADKLRQRNAQTARERSWRLDMAIRAVRVSCSHEEQERALAALESVLESF